MKAAERLEKHFLGPKQRRKMFSLVHFKPCPINIFFSCANLGKQKVVA